MRAKMPRWFSAFHPNLVFFTGILSLPALLFQPSVSVRAVTALVLFLTAKLLTKRGSWFITLFLWIFIILFHLITPYGRVLFSLGPISVTLGTLRAGVLKAGTYTSLFAVSMLSVRKNISIPGRPGRMVSTVFYYFELLLEEIQTVQRKNLFASLDDMLLRVFSVHPEETNTAEQNQLQSLHVVICTLFLGIMWGLLLFGYAAT
ncbi:MAG: hypothetical protein ACLFR1_13425 [Spirochaetia bacterium]